MIKATYIDHMGNDLTVANAARVALVRPVRWKTILGVHLSSRRKDDKLIRYLAKHKHISPFGHCFASFHVKAPVFVARQLVKHKFLRWNEISRRYVDHEPEFYEPDVWRGRSDDKKQGSEGIDSNTDSEVCSGTALDYITKSYLRRCMPRASTYGTATVYDD